MIGVAFHAIAGGAVDLHQHKDNKECRHKGGYKAEDNPTTIVLAIQIQTFIDRYCANRLRIGLALADRACPRVTWVWPIYAKYSRAQHSIDECKAAPSTPRLVMRLGTQPTSIA